MLNSLKFILSHPLNRGRPLSTLARYASWQIRSRLQAEIVVDWIEGTKLVACNGMTGATGNIYCGLHEYSDMGFLLHLLRPGDLFVDIGANIGSYTLLASGVCGARTLAIEPDPEAVSRIKRNNDENNISHLVDVEQTAVGERNGDIAFTRGQDTRNRVATHADESVQVVSLTRIDDLLDGLEPSLIKLDVEGHETEALRGAIETLSKPSLRAILLETVDEEVYSMLTDHGFVREGYDPATRDLIAPTASVGSNMLFLRDTPKVLSRLASAPKRRIQAVQL